jgi:hypothetical protein
MHNVEEATPPRCGIIFLPTPPQIGREADNRTYSTQSVESGQGGLLSLVY